MAGDEIVADWLGDINSFYINATTSVTRISGTSLRYRSADIFNSTGTIAIYIGWYNSNITTFTNFSIVLKGGESIKLEYVDLYDLGCYCATGTVKLKFLCLNEY